MINELPPVPPLSVCGVTCGAGEKMPWLTNPLEESRNSLYTYEMLT
jgi:hypothetical protein